MVFLCSHAVSDTEKHQCIEDDIDRRMRNGQDQASARGKDPLAFGGQHRWIIDVFENGEHGNAIEASIVESAIIGETPSKDLDASVARGRNVCVDAHSRSDPRKDSIDEASVVATDIEEAITTANEGHRHPDPPTLEKTIEGLHAGGPGPRRRIPSML